MKKCTEFVFWTTQNTLASSRCTHKICWHTQLCILAQPGAIVAIYTTYRMCILLSQNMLVTSSKMLIKMRNAKNLYSELLRIYWQTAGARTRLYGIHNCAFWHNQEHLWQIYAWWSNLHHLHCIRGLSSSQDSGYYWSSSSYSQIQVYCHLIPLVSISPWYERQQWHRHQGCSVILERFDEGSSPGVLLTKPYGYLYLVVSTANICTQVRVSITLCQQHYMYSTFAHIFTYVSRLHSTPNTLFTHKNL